MSNNEDHLDSTLAAVALLAAYIDGDHEGVDAVLADEDDHDAIMSSLLFMLKDVLTKVSDGQPHRVLDGLRDRIIHQIAERDGGQ